MTVIPGPLVLNIESLRREAEVAARRSLGKSPRLRATDVCVTADDSILVRLVSEDGLTRWATLLEPEGDISHLGILRFQFSDTVKKVV